MSEHQPTVLLEQDGPIARLILDNPRRLNALTPAMLQALAGHLETIEQDAAIRVVVLSGSGERAFCVGADINAWGDLPPFEFARHWVRGGHRIFDRLARLAVPTIAALNGHAFGGGLELAAACDLRVAAEHVQLALPEASVGVVPGWSGTQRLVGLLPPALVKEMLFTGRRLSAERAYQVGFINELVETPVLAAALAMAGEVVTLAPRSVEIAKYMINAALDEDRAALVEALGSGLIAASADRAEGVASFREKRAPGFRGS